MLELIIPLSDEGWDDANQEFVEAKTLTLKLEHSLVSISKWESKWCKPFLSSENKSLEETLDYIKFMTLSQNVKPDVYERLTMNHIQQINEYISAPMTATTFRKEPGSKKNNEILTAELIYYWMIAFNIPHECQKWHLNKLLTLIRVCDIKNRPPKKRSRSDILSENARLNAERRKALNSRG